MPTSVVHQIWVQVSATCGTKSCLVKAVTRARFQATHSRHSKSSGCDCVGDRPLPSLFPDHWLRQPYAPSPQRCELITTQTRRAHSAPGRWIVAENSQRLALPDVSVSRNSYRHRSPLPSQTWHLCHMWEDNTPPEHLSDTQPLVL